MAAEKRRQHVREVMFARTKFIETNLPALEAIAEGKRVSTYFETDEQAIEFVHAVHAKKVKELESFGF